MATLSVSVRGYRALTHEELAAVVVVVPRPDHKFLARFTFPDSSVRIFNLSGDQLYVDARILKWKAVANLIGVHTSYELDRVGGRYSQLSDETSRPHTVFALSEVNRIDLFRLRKRFQQLNPLVDATYGSATFASAESFGEFQVLVSTTGLLIRQVNGAPDR